MTGIRNKDIGVTDIESLKAAMLNIILKHGVLDYNLEVPEDFMRLIGSFTLEKLEQYSIDLSRFNNLDNDYFGDWQFTLRQSRKLPSFELTIWFDEPDENGNEYECWSVHMYSKKTTGNQD